MKGIIVKNITKNNLKNFSVNIPLKKLVTIVGPSGSGKSTLVHGVLYDNLISRKWNIENLPKKIEILEQKVVLPADSKMSLGQYNLDKLRKKLATIDKEDLLIVDEPCAGFCKKERLQILDLLKNKVKKGYSIIAVEHNKEVIAGSDYVIELGPRAGCYGGKLIFEGSLTCFKKSGTITSRYVFSPIKANKRKKSISSSKIITISRINTNIFNNYKFSFPLIKTVCLVGCSGTGKTTLLDVAYRALFKGKNAWKIRLKSVDVNGKTNVRRSFIVPQTPIGEHPTSTLGTYARVWDNIRIIFADEQRAKQLKLSKSDFILSKDILDDRAKLPSSVLSVKFRGKNIKEVSEMTIDEALKLFEKDKLIVRKLKFLQEVGLGYLVLKQKSGSLSGGEAQRVRVAKILSKKLGDRSVYIFDTPTRGLHLKDIPVLGDIFRKIVDKNNTILIADNREEIFNYCDYIISL